MSSKACLFSHLFQVTGISIFFALLLNYKISVYNFQNNFSIYLFLLVKNILYDVCCMLGTGLIKYCCQVSIRNQKYMQSLITFSTVHLFYNLPTSTYDLSGFMYVRGIADTSFVVGFTTFSGSSSRILSRTLPICLPDPINLKIKYIIVFYTLQYQQKNLYYKSLANATEQGKPYHLFYFGPHKRFELQTGVMPAHTILMLKLKKYPSLIHTT
jgi:hypothetical protein